MTWLTAELCIQTVVLWCVGGGKSIEATIGEVAADILTRLPANFDVDAVAAAYPTSYSNSMNMVRPPSYSTQLRPLTCVADHNSLSSCLLAASGLKALHCC